MSISLSLGVNVSKYEWIDFSIELLNSAIAFVEDVAVEVVEAAEVEPLAATAAAAAFALDCLVFGTIFQTWCC